MRSPRFLLSPALVVLIGLSAAAVAKADVYQINTSNFAGNQNFGSITTTLVGNSIQVQVQLTAGFVLHGSGVGFKVVDPDGTVSITGISAPTFFSVGAGGQFDGFGTFTYSVEGPSTATARANNLNSITFTVNSNRNAGAGFTNANQLEELSNQGRLFAVQIAPLDPNQSTGFATTGSTQPTPEPTTMLLLGSGLAGTAGALRRRRRNKK